MKIYLTFFAFLFSTVAFAGQPSLYIECRWDARPSSDRGPSLHESLNFYDLSEASYITLFNEVEGTRVEVKRNSEYSMEVRLTDIESGITIKDSMSTNSENLGLDTYLQFGYEKNGIPYQITCGKNIL